MDDHSNEFTSRDEVAQLIFLKFMDKLISGLAVSITELANNEMHQKRINNVMEKISIISYQGADSMRKARLGAFK